MRPPCQAPNGTRSNALAPIGRTNATAVACAAPAPSTERSSASRCPAVGLVAGPCSIVSGRSGAVPAEEDRERTKPHSAAVATSFRLRMLLDLPPGDGLEPAGHLPHR